MPTNPTKQIDPVVEARQLLARATPGPWKTKGYSPGWWQIEGPEGEQLVDVNYSDGLDEPTIYPEEANANLIARAPELLKTLADEVDQRTRALKLMVELWDANHPDDPCGCVGASDDCKYPPTCELCVARLTLEGRINEDRDT